MLTTRRGRAQASKIRIGLLLPHTGPAAPIGAAVANGFKLAVDQRGGKFAGLELDYLEMDSRADGSQSASELERLMTCEAIIAAAASSSVIDTIHGAAGRGALVVVADGGMDAVTGSLCAPYLFRTSYSHWQLSYPLGRLLAGRGIRRVVSAAWRHNAGEETVAGFTEGFVRAGGTVVRGLWMPYPNTDFKAVISKIASLRPDAVLACFSGSGAAGFLKDYSQSGLKKLIPLFGTGLLTEDALSSVDGAAEGIETTLHYADGLDNSRDKEFRAAYRKAYGGDGRVYAVQGYDAAVLLAAGLDAVRGDLRRQKDMIAAMERMRIDSPRGVWFMSKAHNPIQNIYLRQVKGRENRFAGFAHKALADPGRGCTR